MLKKYQFMENIKERVLQLIENQKIEKEYFFNKIGVSYSNFRGIQKKTSLNSDTIDKILSEIKDLNLNWLITGKGTMFIEENLINSSIFSKEKKIPFVDTLAIMGFGNSDFVISESNIIEFYEVPEFKNEKVDFMTRAKGSSMYPKYNSGDIIACRILKDSKFIQWNKTHLIATTEQGLLVKRLQKNENPEFITAVSDNKEYPPFDIPMNEITGIAFIVGVIRLE